MTKSPKPIALTIAGSDSSGGAGLQADLKAFEANGVFGMSVVTAVTAQNTRGVHAIHDIPVELISAQLDAIADDFQVSAIKIGMLSSSETIEAVATGLSKFGGVPTVVDPVMVATSGDLLLQSNAVDALVELVLPAADLLTPNVKETEVLSGVSIRSTDDARQAACSLLDQGPQAVLVKGGHLDGQDDAVDVLAGASGETFFRAERIETMNTHGTGCTYASAIAANLAKGFSLIDSIQRAKAYLTEAIRHSLDIGSGHGPTNHFWFLDGG